MKQQKQQISRDLSIVNDVTDNPSLQTIVLKLELQKIYEESSGKKIDFIKLTVKKAIEIAIQLKSITHEDIYKYNKLSRIINRLDPESSVSTDAAINNLTQSNEINSEGFEMLINEDYSYEDNNTQIALTDIGHNKLVARIKELLSPYSFNSETEKQLFCSKFSGNDRISGVLIRILHDCVFNKNTNRVNKLHLTIPEISFKCMLDKLNETYFVQIYNDIDKPI